MKIKVCGMKYPENILEVGNLLPDYMGFIFWKGSPRYFESDIPVLPESIRKVGVFVNESTKIVLAQLDRHSLNILQLHGNESPSVCSGLRKNTTIIKAFSIDETFDFDSLLPYEDCNYFLFDTKGNLKGGNGVSFDWTILEKYKMNVPVFLSGGISLADAEKINELQLPIHAVDVNSRFELAPGLKDVQSLKKFKNTLL